MCSSNCSVASLILCSWEGKEGGGSLEDARALQLDFRVREVHEVFESFKDLSSGQAGDLDITGLDKAKAAGWEESFRDKVDTDSVYLTGHSFGGGTMVSWSVL